MAIKYKIFWLYLYENLKCKKTLCTFSPYIYVMLKFFYTVFHLQRLASNVARVCEASIGTASCCIRPRRSI